MERTPQKNPFLGKIRESVPLLIEFNTPSSYTPSLSFCLVSLVNFMKNKAYISVTQMMDDTTTDTVP
jgi:hypothetical protein